MEEIPNRRNAIGYEEEKGGNNAQKENPSTVYGLQLTRNALKDDNKKMRGRKAEVENYVCCKDK